VSEASHILFCTGISLPYISTNLIQSDHYCHFFFSNKIVFYVFHYSQHDAHEFFTDLMNAMESELVSLLRSRFHPLPSVSAPLEPKVDQSSSGEGSLMITPRQSILISQSSLGKRVYPSDDSDAGAEADAEGGMTRSRAQILTTANKACGLKSMAHTSQQCSVTNRSELQSKLIPTMRRFLTVMDVRMTCTTCHKSREMEVISHSLSLFSLSLFVLIVCLNDHVFMYLCVCVCVCRSCIMISPCCSRER
jgi:hypothetical protein